eukprot:UN21939
MFSIGNIRQNREKYESLLNSTTLSNQSKFFAR